MVRRFFVPTPRERKPPSVVKNNLPLIIGLSAGAVAFIVVILFLLAVVRRRKAQSSDPVASEVTPLSLSNGTKAKEPSLRSSSPDDSFGGSQSELREFFPLRRLSTPAMFSRPRSPRPGTPEDFLKRRFSAIPEGAFPTYDLPKYSCLKERFSIFGGDLDPSLYGSDEDLMLHTLNSYGAGKLCFSLSYSVKHKTLFVTIHKATYLSSRTAKESGNFYVKVSLVPSEGKPHRTTTVSTIRNPIFEQSFSFALEPQDVETKRVQFTVKEATRMDKNITIGSVWFKLHEAQLTEHAETLQEVWRDIICVDKVSMKGHGRQVEVTVRNP